MPRPGQVQDPAASIGSETVGLENFEQLVVERSRELPVVVDFWAAWCGPCRALGPVLEREAERLAGAVELVKVDVDAEANRPLAQQYGIRGIPAVKAFRNGTVVDEFVGALPPEAVRTFLERLTAPPAAQQIVAELRDAAELPAVADALEAGDFEAALELLLELIRTADEPGRDRLRGLMLRVFEDLGQEHPLAVSCRRRLAATLY